MLLHKLMHHPILAVLRQKQFTQVGALILRLAVGAVFMYHGYPKLFGAGPAVYAKFFANIGIPAPWFFVPFVGVVEFFGGLCLILGLGARFWGAGYVIDMAVAILKATNLQKFMSYELELLLLSAGAYFFLSGAGEFSLDAWLMERSRKAHETSMPVVRK